MAGFDKIKRTLCNEETNEIILEDIHPLSVEYQKFYSDEDMLRFSHEIFIALRGEFLKDKLGRYNLYVDTMGVYMNSSVSYDLALQVTCTAVYSNLDDVFLPELVVSDERN